MNVISFLVLVLPKIIEYAVGVTLQRLKIDSGPKICP